MDLTDATVLASELERVRVDYNETRLREAMATSPPDDEHQDRGDAIRSRVASPALNEPTGTAGSGIAITGAGHHPPCQP